MPVASCEPHRRAASAAVAVGHRQLGESGLRVSRLGLGTLLFGGPTPEAQAREIVASARDSGVNLIDTSAHYQRGAADRVVARVLAGQRNHWVLSAHLGPPPASACGRAGKARDWVRRAVDTRLGRLGSGHIDLLYLHRWGHDAPLDEGIRAVADLVRSGKVRGFGLSHAPAWRLSQAAYLADAEGTGRPVASQCVYHLLNRQAEIEHFPAAAALGLGVVVSSPLAAGVLTGKYPSCGDAEPGSRAARKDRRMLQTEWRIESLEAVDELRQHLRGDGRGLAAFSLAWLLRHQGVSSALAGPRSLAQWQAYLAALGTAFGDEDEALVDRLVPPGAASTHGYADPASPVAGRVLISAGCWPAAAPPR